MPSEGGRGGEDAAVVTDASAPTDASRTEDARAPSDASDASVPAFRSCAGLPATCGARNDEDCCASLVVPGGTFFRSYDGVTHLDKTHPATVAAFRLDKYEVTVGRMRKFVSNYTRSMIPAGAGKNPNDPDDPGWLPQWETNMPANYVELTRSLSYWEDAVADHPENMPVGAVSWYAAFAFCVWDGGRLPTEAEWNFAAAGGTEQRVYPWGKATNDGTRAADVFTGCDGNPCDAPLMVGSKPAGNGKWGHADLVGNVEEWTVDVNSSFPMPCVNCAVTNGCSAGCTADDPFGPLGDSRIIRGGSFAFDVVVHSVVDASERVPRCQNHYLSVQGFRCARPMGTRDCISNVDCLGGRCAGGRCYGSGELACTDAGASGG